MVGARPCDVRGGRRVRGRGMEGGSEGGRGVNASVPRNAANFFKELCTRLLGAALRGAKGGYKGSLYIR